MTFARITPTQRKAQSASRRRRNLKALAKPIKDCNATMGGGLTGAVAKTVAKRNRTLLDMAERRPCLLQVPGVCTNDTATTVACHSNLSAHGKAAARKADDCYCVWGCLACHRWLDQPIGSRGPTYEEKAMRFQLAHLSQVNAWRAVSTDSGEPERFRKAAQWALDELGATPVGEL